MPLMNTGDGADPVGIEARDRAPLPAITAVGELAPDFTLTTIDKTADVTLSSYIGERPVALIFGSYT